MSNEVQKERWVWEGGDRYRQGDSPVTWIGEEVADLLNALSDELALLHHGAAIPLTPEPKAER